MTDAILLRHLVHCLEGSVASDHGCSPTEADAGIASPRQRVTKGLGVGAPEARGAAPVQSRDVPSEHFDSVAWRRSSSMIGSRII